MPESRARRQTHRDRVFAALRDTGVRMVRTDEKGLKNILYDKSDVRVGEVNFDSKEEFVGGQFYKKIIVKGRLMNKHEALSSFIDTIGEMHNV